MIKPKKNTISILHSQKQCTSFPQSNLFPGLMFSKPGIQNLFPADPKQDLLPHAITTHLPTIQALQTTS